MTEYAIAPESAHFSDQIEELHAEAFGPGRFARAAFRLREQGPHDAGLSFVATGPQGNLLGSVRQTWIGGEHDAREGLLLGPLAVQPAVKNMGIGKALVKKCVEAAGDAQASFVLLVGDAPYYAPLGFQMVPKGNLALPGPVDPARLLMFAFDEDVLETALGKIRHARR